MIIPLVVVAVIVIVGGVWLTSKFVREGMIFSSRATARRNTKALIAVNTELKEENQAFRDVLEDIAARQFSSNTDDYLELPQKANGILNKYS